MIAVADHTAALLAFIPAFILAVAALGGFFLQRRVRRSEDDIANSKLRWELLENGLDRSEKWRTAAEARVAELEASDAVKDARIKALERQVVHTEMKLTENEITCKRSLAQHEEIAFRQAQEIARLTTELAQVRGKIG